MSAHCHKLVPVQMADRQFSLSTHSTSSLTWFPRALGMSHSMTLMEPASALLHACATLRRRRRQGVNRKSDQFPLHRAINVVYLHLTLRILFSTSKFREYISI